jgi:hypothetical protein
MPSSAAQLSQNPMHGAAAHASQLRNLSGASELTTSVLHCVQWGADGCGPAGVRGAVRLGGGAPPAAALPLPRYNPLERKWTQRADGLVSCSVRRTRTWLGGGAPPAPGLLLLQVAVGRRRGLAQPAAGCRPRQHVGVLHIGVRRQLLPRQPHDPAQGVQQNSAYT